MVNTSSKLNNIQRILDDAEPLYHVPDESFRKNIVEKG